ncbi:DUF305 domain-containing protein [Streptomyces sp. NPDC048481]|uniref:DUF305 domain-containing protein n=1 Tax=Streptomyces sp. NPDC048481 TaxID=3365557 RepID=UPI00371FFAD2
MRTTRSLTRRATLAAVCAAAALTLAACGTGGDGEASSAPAAPSSSSAAADAHNRQDVSFAQGMIPHHRQALEMAELAAGRTASAQVEDLASRIEKAQNPEITAMSGWLTAWGEKVPAKSGSMAGSMPGMDHSGGTAMPGMMGAADMDRLTKASGKEFDTLFLTMMVRHHQGAVDMAAVEKSKGAYGPARTMAGSVVTAQTAEIAEMNRILGKR